MSQIAEELTKLENLRCSCDFVSQEAKVTQSFSTWPLCHATMLFGHIGCPKNAKKIPFFGPYIYPLLLEFFINNHNGPKE